MKERMEKEDESWCSAKTGHEPEKKKTEKETLKRGETCEVKGQRHMQ